MDLLGRYLQAVRFWLPRAKQDDIVAELSEDIRSQIEEREKKLGSKLSEAEIGELLKKRGRPMLVANQFLPQQSLIGPVLFPIYKFVLKIVILFYLLPIAILFHLVPWLLAWRGFMSYDTVSRSMHSVGDSLAGTWESFWVAALIAVGVVTIVFAVLERMQVQNKLLEDWDPSKLRPVRDPNRIPRASSIVELGVNVVFVGWWVNGMWSQTIFEHSGVRIVFGPVWQYFFWAFLLLALGNIALAAVNLFRPYWTRLRGSIRLIGDVAGSVVFCWLFRVHILAEIRVPNVSAARAAEICNAINVNMARSFPFAVLACVMIVALADVGRLVRLRSKGTRQQQMPTTAGV
ncbi:MAG: hypothetical protein ACRD50_00655 [Candidatus Acidiferrales bacterium]